MASSKLARFFRVTPSRGVGFFLVNTGRGGRGGLINKPSAFTTMGFDIAQLIVS